MKVNPIILGAGAVGLYLILKPNTTTPGVVAPSAVPTGTTTTTNPITSLINTILPQPTQTAAPIVGINSGIKGGNGSFYTVSNYAQLLALNPNLGNPNYQMTQTEANQYLANYADLQQGLPSWIGRKQPDGIVPANIQQAAQEHWHFDGCAEKRIFYPLQPPSTANYIPPPVATRAAPTGSSGNSWYSAVLTTAIQVASAAAKMAGFFDGVPDLNDAEVNVIVSGSAIVKKLLPFYLAVDKNTVNSIENRIDVLVSNYSS